MRSLLLSLVVFCAEGGCGTAARPEPELPRPEARPPVESAPPPIEGIPLASLGAEPHERDWIDLDLPTDARASSFAQTLGDAREIWTLAEAGSRRVLRVRFAHGDRVGHAAYAGTPQRDGIAFRLVERKGTVRFAPERLTATCQRATVCPDDKPTHRVTASECTFADADSDETTVVWLGAGRGVDFVVGSCAQPPRREPMAMPHGRPMVMPRESPF